MKFCKRFPRTSSVRQEEKSSINQVAIFLAPCSPPQDGRFNFGKARPAGRLSLGGRQEADSHKAGHTHDQGLGNLSQHQGLLQGRRGEARERPRPRKPVSKSVLWKPDSGHLCLKGARGESCARIWASLPGLTRKQQVTVGGEVKLAPTTLPKGFGRALPTP